MKKTKSIVLLFVIILILAGGIVANAEILPVKDAWILHENCIVVLREDGTLTIANSIDSQKADFVENNVFDFCGTYDSGRISGIVLYKNGDVAKLWNSYYNTEESNYKISVVATNAKEIYLLSQFSYAYLDNNNVLIGRRNNYKEDTVVMKNVKRCYGCAKRGSTIYAIGDDDILYGINVKMDTVNEIMTDVKDMMFFNNGGEKLVILRNNQDLYFFEDGKMPQRIGQKIAGIDDVVIAYGAIYYVDINGNLFKDDLYNEVELLENNISKIFYTMENGTLYYITKNNDLYSLAQLNRTFFIDDNVKAILGNTRYFFEGMDGHLYDKETWASGHSKLYIENIRDVIKYDGELGKDDDRYLFICDSGELYAAFGKTFNKPFITSFCQKPTKVVINGEEIELTAKIQVVNGRSMYPFRECLENMGATVMWDDVNKIAIGEYNGITIEFPINKNEYWINGEKHEMDTQSYLDTSLSKTYIPIRYAAEGLGFTVEWTSYPSENIISIYN